MLYRKMFLCLVVLAVLSTAYAVKTEVPLTGVDAFYSSDQNNNRNRGDMGFLIDDNEATSSYSTGGFTDLQTIIAFDLGGSHTINQFRLFKVTANIDGTGTVVDHPNLEILVSADTGALYTRSYYRVSGLINGDQGSELFTAVSVNSDGTIIGDTSDNKWCTVTFDPATVTAVAFSVVRPVTDDWPFVHFPMTEVEAYYDTSLIPPQASGPVPADGATDVAVTTGLGWVAGIDTASQTVSVGTDPNALTVAATGDGSLASVSNAQVETALGGSMGMVTKYYWKVDSVNTDSNSITGNTWSFTTEMGVVKDPTPTDGATRVLSDATLQWVGFSAVDSYDVYLVASDANDLATATPVNVSIEEYTHGGLLDSTTYFWKVEALDSGAAVLVTSDVWSFKTAGLTHHWKADDAADSTVMVDSISGANGDLSGLDQAVVNFVNDAERGQVLEFLSNAHLGVPCGDIEPMTGNCTLSVWAKRPSIQGNAIFSFASGFQLGFDMGIDPDTSLVYDTLDMYIGNIWWVPGAVGLGNTWPITDGPLVPTGIDEWHMFTVTSVGGTTTIYRDGTFQASLSEVGWGHPTDLVIGQNNLTGAGTWGYVGRLDDLSLYNMGLNATQVRDLYFEQTHVEGAWICETVSPFDLNGDCRIEIGDIAIFAAGWLDCGRYPSSECP